jgi:16S rRNA (guanine527-N7)-methyltransferase
MNNTAALVSNARNMGVELATEQADKLLLLAQRLAEWNLQYNLTAIKEPAKIITHHLLDSLSAHSIVAGAQIADVGTGAGFPGLPLAITHPEMHFTLIDSVLKKLRFVEHMAQELGLANVQCLHSRVEQLTSAGAFDTVITRAFAPLPRLCQWLSPICNEVTTVIAMKGLWPPAAGMDDAGPLPDGWRVEAVRPVKVPGIEAERYLLTLRRGC